MEADGRLRQLTAARAWESAAVALAEQVFPGCEHGYYYYKHRPGDEYAKATVAKIGGPHAEDIKARTPALALCLAIISVMAEPNQ